MTHTILYSHGFGVRKDDRGLFTDIADALPELNHIMFDYNQFDEETNTLNVSPIHEQAKRLQVKLEELNNEDTVDLIAHSQGCIVAALAKPLNVRKIICLAPPDNIDTERMLSYFGKRPGSEMDLDGQSRIPRRDGSTTIIPAEYWRSAQGLDVIGLYNQLPDLAEVKFVIASEDEVLGMTNFDYVDERIQLIHLRGSHDFAGYDRKELIELLNIELT